MTQKPKTPESPVTENKRPAFNWIIDLGEEKNVNTEYRKLIAACKGNRLTADVLKQVLFQASIEAQRRKIDLKSCKSITFTPTHDSILNGIQMTEKTMIGHLRRLDILEYVLSKRYGRSLTVDLDKLREGMSNPPAPDVRKPPPRKQKKAAKVVSESDESCKSTGLENEIDLAQKVVDLQEIVGQLQQKVGRLQEIVGRFQLYNFSEGALQAGVDGEFAPLHILHTIPKSTESLCDAARADITDTHRTEVNDAVVLGDTAGPVSRDDGTADSLRPGSDGRASMVGSSLQAQDAATEATSQVQTAQTEEVTEVVVEPLATAARSDIDVPDGVCRAQETVDSYSHATPDPLPSVSFLEANTALEMENQRNVGAADENEYHSQDSEAEYVPEWAQGAANDTRNSLCDSVLAAGNGAAGDHRRPVVGDIHGAHGHQAGPEGQSVLRASNPAVQRPDGDGESPGTASRSAGERGGRRAGERSARPDSGDDRPVVPGGGGTARGRGGKGTGVAAQGGGNRRTPKPPEPEVQLTLGGSQVREWYETIRETRIRLTAGNKRALNGLAECDGMTFDNLKDVIEYLDKHELVKKRGLVVDLQTLEKPDYYFNFEKTLQVVQRNRRGKSEVHRQKIAQEQAANDIYSIASIYRDHGVPIPSA